MQRSLAHAWVAVWTSVTMIRSIDTYFHRHTSMHVWLLAFLSIPDSWWHNFDSLSLLIQSYTPTCILVCVYVLVLFWFVFLSIPYSWLPNSLFLLDTGCLTCVCVCIDLLFFFFLSIPYIWLPNSLLQLETGILLCKTTSCRPCHPVFLPDFHHFSECAFWSWLSTEIVCLSASVDFLPLLDMYWSLFLVLLVCMCVRVCVTVCTGRQTDTVETLAKQYQHIRARAHTCRDHSHTLDLRCWRVWRWFIP